MPGALRDAGLGTAMLAPRAKTPGTSSAAYQ